MLGDASSNVPMQYLRGDVLLPETEEHKMNHTSFIKVKIALDEHELIVWILQ